MLRRTWATTRPRYFSTEASAPSRPLSTMRPATPLSVAIGELNGDGRPDSAIANVALEASSVSVLVNRGDGSFQPKVDYGTGHNPESLAIGDVTGDGKADLATANTVADTVSSCVIEGTAASRPPSTIRADILRSHRLRRPEPRRQGRSRQRDSQDNGVSVCANRGAGASSRSAVRSRSDRTLGRDRRSERRPCARSATANAYDDSVSVIMTRRPSHPPNVMGRIAARASRCSSGPIAASAEFAASTRSGSSGTA